MSMQHFSSHPFCLVLCILGFQCKGYLCGKGFGKSLGCTQDSEGSLYLFDNQVREFWQLKIHQVRSIHLFCTYKASSYIQRSKHDHHPWVGEHKCKFLCGCSPDSMHLEHRPDQCRVGCSYHWHDCTFQLCYSHHPADIQHQHISPLDCPAYRVDNNIFLSGFQLCIVLCSHKICIGRDPDILGTYTPWWMDSHCQSHIHLKKQAMSA